MDTRGRRLTCNRCTETLRVYEQPRPFLDPNLYVCGQCLEAKTVTELTFAEREETRVYDPSQSLLPF